MPLKIPFLGNFVVDYSSESHYAKTLQSMGHKVIPLQETKATPRDIRTASFGADLFVWVHTHGWHTPQVEELLADAVARGVPVITYHLDLWKGLEREKDMGTDPYWRVLTDFFTVDPQMADHLNQNTTITGHYLPPGVFGPECYLADPTDDRFDVVFVGSYGYHPEFPFRPKLVDWLRTTYGPRFRHYGGGGLPTVRGADLNQVYANAKVAVGDTLSLNLDYPGYYSDRLFECPGRGGFQIFPRIKGIEDNFIEGEEMVFYTHGDLDELKAKIDHYLAHDDERERIRRAGHERTKRDHTYHNRWTTILTELGLV